MKTRDRILNRIAECHGALSVGLLAADLGLSVNGTEQHVRTLIKAGRVVIGWDGRQLELSDAEARDRAFDAAADRALKRAVRS